MFFSFAILCFAGVSMTLSEKIHEKMSIEQIEEVFHKSHHDLVPHYEVVQFDVSMRNKRNTLAPEKLVARAFGNDIRVWLTPSVGVLATKNTPVYRAYTTSPNSPVYYSLIPNIMRKVGDLWEDPQQRASFIVKRDANGQYAMNGFIGEQNLVVRALPQSISNHLIQKRSLNDSETSTNARSAYHVVFRGDELDSTNKTMFSDLYGQSSRTPNGVQQTPREEVFFPEVMVVVDYNLYSSWARVGNTYETVLQYLLAFWNGVDLLYRKLQQPSIRFNIARIIIATDNYATPYIADNVDEQGRLKGHEAWRAVQQYYYQKLNTFHRYSYDTVVTMTGREIFNTADGSDLLGLATGGGMCGIDHVDRKVLSVVLTKDDGHFTNIFTAAHEIGHLLGVKHDGNGTSCSGTSGHIMNAEAWVSELSHDFSSCSLAMLNNYFNLQFGYCMRNRPSGLEPLPRFLPGDLVGRDALCRHRGSEKSCYTGIQGQSPCGAIYCTNRDGQCVEDPFILPTDGSPCGFGKICINGQCLFRGY